MKKIVSLVALMALLAATNAWAGPKFKVEPLRWLTSAAAYAAPGTRDSTIFTSSGTAGATLAQGADTSLAVSLLDVVPSSVIASADNDSAYGFTVVISPWKASSLTAAANDSFYVIPQVSLNGVDWFDGPVRSDQIDGLAMVEHGSTNTYERQFWIAGTHAAAGAAPSAIQLYGYPLIRFIIRNDASATPTGQWEGKIIKSTYE